LGELGKEDPRSIEVIDLETNKALTFNKTDIQSIQRNTDANTAIERVGLPAFMAWRISRVVPLSSARGKIAHVDGPIIYVSVGSNLGVEIGDELVVYRGNIEIRDPDTGELLGTQPRRLARLQAVEVTEKLTKARLQGDLETQFEVGDAVESVATSSSIAILPLVTASNAETVGTKRIAEELTTGLVNRGVSVVERRLLNKVLSELGMQQSGLFDAEKAQKVGKQLGAYAIVMGTIAPRGNIAEAQLRVVRVETGEILAAASQILRDRSVATHEVSEVTTPVSLLDGEWEFFQGWLSGKQMVGEAVANSRIIIKGNRYNKFVAALAIEGQIIIDSTTSPMRLALDAREGRHPEVPWQGDSGNLRVIR